MKSLSEPRHAGIARDANAEGRAAAFECGTSIRFTLRIEPEQLRIEEILFTTTGCGYMIHAADGLAERLTGKLLPELHALEEIGSGTEFPAGREHCFSAPLEAVRLALAEFREARVREFHGESPLICTCFGVTEEVIEAHAAAASSVEEIGDATNAGTGCGSCRMLIQEILDAHWR